MKRATNDPGSAQGMAIVASGQRQLLSLPTKVKYTSDATLARLELSQGGPQTPLPSGGVIAQWSDVFAADVR